MRITRRHRRRRHIRLKINFKLLHWQMQANNHTHKQTRRVKSSGVNTIAFQKCACAISISINTPNSHTQILCTHWIWLAGWSAATKKLDGDKLLIQIKLDLTYDVRYFSHTHVLCKMQLHKMTCNFSHKFCVNFSKFKKILTHGVKNIK